MEYPLIEFAPRLNLTAEELDKVLAWPTLQKQIEERQAQFNTSRILINGVSFVGPVDNKKLLLAQARVFYTDRSGNESSYHVNFIPDAAVLLVVFRVAGNEVAGDARSLGNHHVVMIKQSRWGLNEKDSLEIPGGLLKEGKTLDFSSWENPAMGALREFREESVSPENAEIFPALNPADFKTLGAPVKSHPGLTDQQHQFYLEYDITAEKFEQLKNALVGSRAGYPAEQEVTEVTLIPFEEAYICALDSGQAPSVVMALARYRNKAHLLNKISN